MSSVTKQPTADTAPAPPPGAQIFQMWSGVMVTQLLEVALGHQLPRRLLDGARSSAELAEMTGLHEPSLYRVLRALTMFGIFDEQPERRFTLGPLGPTAAEYEDGFRWGVAAINEVPRTVQDGTPGMELAHGMSFFEYLTEHPAAGRNFDVAQSLINGGEPEAVAESYDFAGVHTLVDVGGGNGTGLAAMLARHAHLRGVLFDQPAVTEQAAPGLAALGDRCEVMGGDFFESIPARGDAYLLSHVIHDWDEERALTILRNCREAMGSGGRLLLIEMVIPPGGEPHPGKMLDVMMLSLTGGMERTEAEYSELLQRAGLRLTRVIPTQTPVSIIEAVPPPA